MGRRDRRHARVPKSIPKMKKLAKMRADEFNAARDTLKWTHERMAEALGVSPRTPYRYASGTKIPEPSVRLLRVLVWARLTLSARKFDQLVSQLN